MCLSFALPPNTVMTNDGYVVGWKEFNVTNTYLVSLYLNKSYKTEVAPDGILVEELEVEAQGIEITAEIEGREFFRHYSERLLPVGMHLILIPASKFHIPVLVAPWWITCIDRKNHVTAIRFIIPPLKWFDQRYKVQSGPNFTYFMYKDGQPPDVTHNRKVLKQIWTVITKNNT